MSKFVLIICMCAGMLLIFALSFVVEYWIHRIRTKISFKDSLKKSELVIIPLENNGKILNFIVDSGSTCNIINEKILPELSILKEDIDTNNVESISLTGKADTKAVISMMLMNSNERFFETFFVMDMTDSLEWSKEELGAEIHGLLGTDFLTRYNKILDFENCIIYSK